MLMAALLIVFHMASAIAMYPFYRDQHLGTALLYMKGAIDVLKPVIVGFNATATPTVLEFPLWQAAAGVAFKIFGAWWGWANVVSILLFSAGLYPLYSLARRHISDRGAWYALLFYIGQPVVFLYAGMADASGTALSITIWFLYAADMACKSGKRRWWLAAAFAASLAAMCKPPFFMPAGIAALYLALRSGGNARQAVARICAIGLFSIAVFTLWTWHGNVQAARAEFPLFDMRLSTNPDMWDWWFGTLETRLSPGLWIKAGWKLLHSLFGSFVCISLAAAAFFIKKCRLGKVWLIGGAVSTFVFLNLVFTHRYYYLLFSPAVALLAACTLEYIECAAHVHTERRAALFAAGVFCAVCLSTVQGLIGMEIVGNYDTYPVRLSRIIAAHTASDDKLVLHVSEFGGGGWGGDQLLRAGREGLTIHGTALLEEPAHVRRLGELGYTKLVMLSESPLLHALQKTNPGSADRQRIVYRSFITPAVEQWPVIYESDDICIKEFPPLQ
jgi:hypothetical protein